MKITTVLFDLDGTLLPMDNEEFTKAYFKLLAKKLVPYGYEAGQLVDAIWAGTAAMVKNDGSQSNEAAFWKKFASICGEKVLADKPLFDEFYLKEFQEAKEICGRNPKAALTVQRAKEIAQYKTTGGVSGWDASYTILIMPSTVIVSFVTTRRASG